MTDLTGALSKAMEGRDRWSVIEVRRVLADLAATLPLSRVDWDEETGEGWGRVLAEGEVVAIVNSHIPLVVAIATAATRLPDSIETLQPVIVTSNSWDAPDFCADPSVMRQAFPLLRESPVVEEAEGSGRMRHFSLGDLWWATV